MNQKDLFAKASYATLSVAHAKWQFVVKESAIYHELMGHIDNHPPIGSILDHNLLGLIKAAISNDTKNVYFHSLALSEMINRGFKLSLYCCEIDLKLMQNLVSLISSAAEEFYTNERVGNIPVFRACSELFKYLADNPSSLSKVHHHNV